MLLLPGVKSKPSLLSVFLMQYHKSQRFELASQESKVYFESEVHILIPIAIFFASLV